uniref:RING-type domain-containing protein n=2 Tax=Caenorhabditis japonica TaxID=281687 RepID=A0A8R1IWP0_CAEJA
MLLNNDTHKPRVLKCGHNVCEPCTTTQRLSTGARCCLICDASRSDRSAPLSHDLLGIVQGKEQALKRIPLKYRCGECSTLYKENDMTVCRTCSGWSEGMQTEEATDFAKRPISSLLCWMCATHSRHATHDKMSIEIVNRIWDTPIAIEYVETQLGTAEKLLELLHGGAIRQIKTLTDDFSE